MLSPEFMQPIFDRVVTHFLSMTQPSYSPGKQMCYYREKKTGNRCFIGALIQDEDYTPSIEGVGISRYTCSATPNSARHKLKIAVVRGLNAMGIDIDDLSEEVSEFLRELQDIHDGWGDAYGREGVTNRLISFAKRRKLSDAGLAK